MAGEEITYHPVPVVVAVNGAQYWKAAGNETFNIVVQQVSINADASVFNTLWRRIVFRIAQVGSEIVLMFFEAGLSHQVPRMSLRVTANG